MGLPDWSVQKHGFANTAHVANAVACTQLVANDLLNYDGAGEIITGHIICQSANMVAGDSIGIDIDGSTYFQQTLTNILAWQGALSYTPFEIVVLTPGVLLVVWVKPNIPFTKNITVTYTPQNAGVLVTMTSLLALLP